MTLQIISISQIILRTIREITETISLPNNISSKILSYRPYDSIIFSLNYTEITSQAS